MQIAETAPTRFIVSCGSPRRRISRSSAATTTYTAGNSCRHTLQPHAKTVQVGMFNVTSRPNNGETDEGQLRNLLLIDDELVLLKAYKLHLSATANVDLAVTGQEALAALDAKHYPVIISDMHMPGMNGIDFIIQAREKCPNSVFMLLTASREKKTAVDALNQAGVFCIINKPCSMPELHDFVNAAFEEYEKQNG
jgi:CheY-like chemotaxis protein